MSSQSEFNASIAEDFEVLEVKRRWIFGGPSLSERLAALERIRARGDWHIVWRLIPFLKDSSKELRTAAASVISALVPNLSRKNELYESLKYCDISVSDIAYFELHFTPDQYFDLLSIASLNLSGYVREEAVRKLGHSNNPQAIPYIIFRVGDWVPQVRKAAISALNSFKAPQHIDDLVANLSFIENLSRIERVNLSQVYDSVLQYLAVDNRTHVIANFRSYAEKHRRILAKFIAQRESVGDEILRKFLNDRSPFIRVLAVEYSEQLTPEDVGRLLADKSAHVRLKILRKLQSRPDFSELVRLYLFDRSVSIRQFARYSLSNAGLDFALLFKEALQRGISVAESLTGLVEVEGKQYVDIAAQFIGNSDPKVVRAAVAAVMKLDKRQGHALALELLDSDVRQLRLLAMRFVSDHVTEEAMERSRQVFQIAAPQRRTELLDMFGRIKGWAALADLILALIDEDPGIRKRAVKYLTAWKLRAGRLFARPSQTELGKIQQAIRSARTHIEKRRYFESSLLDGLEFYLR